jgi:hypothetical protein
MFLDIKLIDIQARVRREVHQRRRVGLAPRREIKDPETRMTHLRFIGDEDDHKAWPVLLREGKERARTSPNLDGQVLTYVPAVPDLHGPWSNLFFPRRGRDSYKVRNILSAEMGRYGTGSKSRQAIPSPTENRLYECNRHLGS